ncbi:early nodulin-like protein 18 [Aristolochia californica]|uniref:early nodulin-like protein 18 n=1 Tax=Aristolochia californica TaxID=171875 RepID=UPI0035E350C4
MLQTAKVLNPSSILGISQNMEVMQRSCRSVVFFLVCGCLVLSVAGAGAYKNYTVGDDLGWFDKLRKPDVDYQKWSAGKNFSLGDYLIFNTDTNHSVIQTYNITTYRQCDHEDAEEDDTIDWSGGVPSSTAEPVSVAVPLLKIGTTYFFSGNYDGEQCKNGQHFKINVVHGQGLPNSLKTPTPDSPAPTSSDDDVSTPDTAIPSNFNRPVQSGEDDNDNDGVKAKSGATIHLPRFLRPGIGRLGLVSISLGLVWVLG